MNIKKTKKSDIEFGTRDVLKDSDFESHNIGHRISIVIPEDVLMRFRTLAEEQGTKYQTLINKVLRESAFSQKTIEQRLAKLEKVLFEKKKMVG